MLMTMLTTGMLKEGPATRYLNGQALYAKKYARAARQVEKRRLKNIRNAEEKDGRELRKMWGDRLKKDKGHKVEERESGSKADMKDVPVAIGGSPGDERGMEKGKIEGKEKEKGKEKDLLDQSWSWTWALEGEAPPPSAIVSRRDFVSRLLVCNQGSGHYLCIVRERWRVVGTRHRFLSLR
jgi:hypothetical protein